MTTRQPAPNHAKPHSGAGPMVTMAVTVTQGFSGARQRPRPMILLGATWRATRLPTRPRRTAWRSPRPDQCDRANGDCCSEKSAHPLDYGAKADRSRRDSERVTISSDDQAGLPGGRSQPM